MLKKQLSERCDQLFKLDMKFNGDSYIGSEDYNRDFNVHHTEISMDTEDQWDKKISKLTEERGRRLTKNK